MAKVKKQKDKQYRNSHMTGVQKKAENQLDNKAKLLNSLAHCYFVPRLQH